MNYSELLKKIFPFSYGAKDVAGLVVKILIYLVAGAVFGILIGLLAEIPVLGILIGIVGAIADIYCLAAIVIAVLDYLKILN